MKGKITAFLVAILLFLSGCGGEKVAEHFSFPFLPPQKIFAGTSGSLVIVFDRDIDSVSGENLPSWSRFYLAAKRRAVVEYAPPVTLSGVFQLKLSAVSGGEKVKGVLQLTVLKPELRVNYPPVLSLPDSVAVREGEEVKFYVSAVDPEGNPVKVSVDASSIGSKGKKFSFDGKVFRWQTDYNSEGEYPIYFTASDGERISTGRVLIEVLDSVPDPELYSEAFTFTIHQGEVFTFRFGIGGRYDGTRVYLSRNIEGMSLTVTGDDAVVRFIPGFNYGDEEVTSFVLVDNGEAKKMVRLTFRVVREGKLLFDFHGTDAFLSPLIYNRYAVLVSMGSNRGNLYLLDFYSDNPVAVTDTIPYGGDIYFSGVAGKFFTIYYGSGEDGEIFSTRLFSSEFTPETGERYISSLHTDSSFSFGIDNGWSGVFHDFLLFPDYTTDHAVKFLRRSLPSQDRLFSEFPDDKWVASPPDSNAPLFSYPVTGVKMLFDGKNHLLVSSSLIDNWPSPHGPVSAHLAYIGLEGDTFSEVKVDYVKPVTLPDDFADAVTEFIMASPGYGENGKMRFLLVDGTGLKGVIGYFDDEGVIFDNYFISFSSRVKRVFPVDNGCFYVYYTTMHIQRFCEIGGRYRMAGYEKDVAGLTSFGGEILNLTTAGGRVFILLGKGGRFQVIDIPEKILQQGG